MDFAQGFKCFIEGITGFIQDYKWDNNYDILYKFN